MTDLASFRVQLYGHLCMVLGLIIGHLTARVGISLLRIFGWYVAFVILWNAGRFCRRMVEQHRAEQRERATTAGEER